MEFETELFKINTKPNILHTKTLLRVTTLFIICQNMHHAVRAASIQHEEDYSTINASYNCNKFLQKNLHTYQITSLGYDNPNDDYVTIYNARITTGIEENSKSAEIDQFYSVFIGEDQNTTIQTMSSDFENRILGDVQIASPASNGNIISKTTTANIDTKFLDQIITEVDQEKCKLKGNIQNKDETSTHGYINGNNEHTGMDMLAIVSSEIVRPLYTAEEHMNYERSNATSTVDYPKISANWNIQNDQATPLSAPTNEKGIKIIVQTILKIMMIPFLQNTIISIKDTRHLYN